MRLDRIKNIQLEFNKENLDTYAFIEGQIIEYSDGVFEGFTKLNNRYICGFKNKETGTLTFQIYQEDGVEDYVAFYEEENRRYVGEECNKDISCDVYIDALRGYCSEAIETQKEYLRYMCLQRKEIEELNKKLVLKKEED